MLFASDRFSLLVFSHSFSDGILHSLQKVLEMTLSIGLSLDGEAVPQLPSDYVLRPLSLNDADLGFVELLEQLTSVRPLSVEQFKDRFTQLSGQKPRGYHIFVIEKESSKKIVATATLVLEWKFIHSCGARGRIEDVVVDREERGKHFGRILNEYLVSLARNLGVYKLSLECVDQLVPFYEKFGFHRDGNSFLVQRFTSLP